MHSLNIIFLILFFNCSALFSQDWMRESIEYKAICAEIYKSATEKLDSALNNKLWSAEISQSNDENIWDKKPAIIIDIDETVLDNSKFFQELDEADTVFNYPMWKNWLARANASAIVGSIDFIKFAERKGIEIFYISNRQCIDSDSLKCPEQEYTIQNLAKLGIKTDDYHVLLKDEYKNWTSNKQVRREILTEQYRILMIIGDDLNDFVNNAINLDSQEKYKHFIDYYNFFGERWFLLPNPKYGSWNKTN